MPPCLRADRIKRRSLSPWAVASKPHPRHLELQTLSHHI